MMLIAGLALALAACSTSTESSGGLGFDFSLDETLQSLRDCDLLSETFVTVITDATDQIDDLAASSNGRIPAAELSARVETITQTGYFAIAERLGCNAVAQRVETVERLRELDPMSADSRDLIAGVIEQLQAR
jgi:hypothetical protein